MVATRLLPSSGGFAPVGTRRALLGGGLVVRATDLFSDTAGTTLQTHAPSSGGSWSKHTASTDNALITDANRVRANTGIGLYFHSWTPGSPDYEVEVTVTELSDNNLSAAGAALRIHPTDNTCYVARYTTNGNTWELYKFITGTGTLLGSGGSAMSVAQTALLRFRAIGPLLMVFVDGAQIITAVDSAITAAGSAGLRLNSTASNSVGVHLDNWVVRQ